MATSNRERIAKGFDHLRDGLVPFVEQELQAVLGERWEKDLSSSIRVHHRPTGGFEWDTQAVLVAMTEYWQAVFKRTLGHFERALVGELREARNRWAHDRTFSSDDTYRALDSMERLLVAVAAREKAADIATLRTELQRTVFAEQARQHARQAAPVEGRPASGLRPWREVVTPHPDVASGNYVQAEFAADLAQVERGDAGAEYGDPVEFYRRTYVTSGLEDLLAGALRRLSGREGDPVIELQTNFGGGKTHSMLALYHLFGGKPARDLPGLETVLSKAGVDEAERAKIAVLVGTALSPAQGSTKADGTHCHTLWGELAWQLGESAEPGGGKAAYELVAASDARGVSPGSDVFTELFRRYAPCLVLIDEWVAYARQTVGKRGLPCGDFESQSSFAQALTEAAKAAPRTLVVASIPASKIEIGGEHGEYALSTLKNVFERLGSAWRPASADEGFEIVRRRLFEPILEKDRFAARDAVTDAFFRMYKSEASDYPAGCGEGGYRKKLLSAYPIHPELFARLYGEWSTLDKFQRTRGVLRLLAKVIHRLWANGDPNLLILPSSVPMDDADVKSELTRYLDDVWEPIISEDVDGPGSLPLELDGSNPNLGRLSACRRVARSLYVGTAPGSNEKNPGIDDRSVRLACTQPGETAAIFGDALRRLADRAKHIHQDQNRYWVSTKTNLNRLADDRAQTYLRTDLELVHVELVRRLRTEKARGAFAAVHICPEDTAEVADEEGARLVILPPKHPHRRGQPETPALAEAKRILEGRGNAPRINRNTLVFLAPDKARLEELESAAARYLAWKSIHEEEEKLNLDAFQRKQARDKHDECNRTVDLRVRETWVHALAPHQEKATAPITWEEVRVSGAASLAERTASKLTMDGLLLDVMGGEILRGELDRYLWIDRDHVSLAELQEYFARYLYLPRIVGAAVLRGAIADGASQLLIDRTFAVAEGFDPSAGRYLGLRTGGDQPVSIVGTTLVVKPEVATKQVDEEPKIQVPGTVPTKEGGSPQIPTSGPTRGAGNTVDGPGAYEAKKLPTVFVASKKLNPLRIGKEAGQIAEEVLQHLSTLPGAEAEITLEIHVKVPGGIKEDVVRTVSENCSTLRFESHGFETLD